MSLDSRSSNSDPLSIDALWSRYAATWSLPDALRSSELAACLSEDVTYCDPQEMVAGRGALSTYMGQFQQAFPGMAFRIDSTLQHHDRTLAAWSLCDPSGTVHQRGTSFAALADDGRLGAITGFFEPPAGA
ncbi:nuclear transport factor 2 family protein [Nocardioides sp.]|uniref:nuclear transport factor 2 family protein n=1 Tax=Nocardioides sp. TaxID=35761 RepID=UPI002C51F564|nr:nuclear transport factor 2 family protein [Nocardioides sp.]HXH80654.1 nuclear transport factor 2 family protein [Nocardioides sp.]